MLKLKKIHILGFKSFCDRTELLVSGTGVAVVVGPNGCGKSNILDGVSWVLGEQSAKSLRGSHMQDVIFAGTNNRKPLGMAEVTLTLIDPEAYDGPIPVEPEIQVDSEEPSDWDEEAFRRRSAVEAEEMAAFGQPGQTLDEGDSADEQVGAAEGPQAVVLKIRRRRFERVQQMGEIVVTRRLFRTGESEYLLNGKLCRLRDIQDIFMGTGLGPESYAIIGQERIGQLLSSKPHERRAIVEEAAGITRFKTKKRLAELRLESSKQNLSRIDDIFEEVTRQMNSLKRQAAKAERFAAVREELRNRLRVVLASRIARMDADQMRLDGEIAALTGEIERSAAEITAKEASQHTLTGRGYELDHAAQEAQGRAGNSAVELERAAARASSNAERIGELDARMAAAVAELEQTRTQFSGVTEERAQQQAFLDSAASAAREFQLQVEAKQHGALAAADAVLDAERQFESGRRNAIQLLTMAGDARKSTAQAEEILAALQREAQRLGTEMSQARHELESLGMQSGQARLRFETSAETLQRLEGEMTALRNGLQARRAQDDELRIRTNRMRSEHAGLSGRRDSLQALIKDHSYATETVRRLLKPGTVESGMAPVGTLADFIEVSNEHEGVVDEFLRDELNYLVVKNWDAAEEGVRLLKSGVDGRATFLIHDAAQGNLFEDFLEQRQVTISHPGVTPLKDAIRVLNGFGHSLEAILPKLGNGYIVESTALAQRLALEHMEAYFLTPGGECFHNATVTGGKPASEGPLALKRELRAAENRLAELDADLARAETEAAALTRDIQNLTVQFEARGEERRQAERDAANQGAVLKQMESETERVDRRLQDWTMQAVRNKDACQAGQDGIEQKRKEAERLEAEHTQAEAALEQQQTTISALRQTRETLQQETARLGAELAGLEERRRGAESAFQRIDLLHAELERRVLSIEQQNAAALAEREQRVNESAALAARAQELTAMRAAALEQAQQLSGEALALRQQLVVLEAELKAGRAAVDQLRDNRANRASELARLRSDLDHLEASCLTEVSVEAAALRADEEIVRLAGEELAAEEEICRGLRQRLEQMGPVNMMALEEYKETAERHGFLETQRKDLMESIENTQQTIREIDQISRTRFDEAFARINENFARVFAHLFHGGSAFLRLTDAENQAESGLDIVASPPGKKLQNVLLLSGGEKALTALALLVGIFQFQPSPFCVLDEVDAALDETNVGRLADLLASLSRETQFLVVTHSKRMMHAADVIYGVTMQEPGVSKIVSVKLSGLEQRATA
ncbi:MAG TPA: chromosome segregation protein SMC [Terracidiphilus sp.]|nr:chromosome segregation protein SMC [Terracidiphilus sp.]